MKKLLLVLFVVVFVAGCSKDDDSKPENALFGTWKAKTEETVYQNANGSPYRDQWITEDEFDDDPEFVLIVNKDVVKAIEGGEESEELPYVYNKDYIEVSFEGEKIRLLYTINGNTLVLKGEERNVNIYNDVIVSKILTTITLEKQ